MLFQLLIGFSVSTLAVVVAAALIGAVIRFLSDIGDWFTLPPLTLKMGLALAGVTIWLTAIVSACVAIWASAFLSIGLFDAVEPAVYFAIVSFTTLGFGDVLLPEEWRLLSGMCAANGLLLFALCAAFLVEFFRRLTEAIRATSQKENPQR